jgi:hypothetical protein
MDQNILCPLCGESDMVEKVSTIYLTGIGLNRGANQANFISNGDNTSAPGAGLEGLSSSDLRGLSRRLKPPATGKGSPFPTLHPDLVVLTFSLVLPVFIFGIFTSQQNMRLPAAVVLAGFYGLYFWKRKAMVARFESQINASRAAKQRAERSIGRWMKLYYCIRDDVVFQPGTGKFVPADQMPGYLTRETTDPEV